MSRTLAEFRETIYNNIAHVAQEQARKEFPFRHHLGASLLGHECARYLFYTFRWVKVPSFSSRTLRIFERGHTEEDNIINLLRKAGFHVFTEDPNTGKQYRAPNLPPHIGGSMDGLVYVPPEYREATDGHEWIVLECKTHNQRSASKTFKHNLGEAYPQHYVQGSIYAQSIGSPVFLYAGLNKNTDELYFEFVRSQYSTAKIAVNRGIEVVNTHVASALDRTSKKYLCNMCQFENICRKNQSAESRNCRSCQHYVTVNDGTWLCSRFNKFVEKTKEIEVAEKCEEWVSIV